jgi:hypothetical protein
LRIHLGNPPAATPPEDGTDAGRPIRQPGRWAGAILAMLAGMILVAVPLSLFIIHSVIFPEGYPEATIDKPPIPWAGIVIMLLLSILAHELLHAVLHPDFGLSDTTVFFLNLMKLQFGVYFEGRIPRGRWIAMRLLPMVVLTFLPVLAYFLAFHWMTFVLETYLIIVILANSLGSGGDLVAVLIVLRQVPPGGVLNFHRGRAYWLPAGESTPSLRRNIAGKTL